MSYWKKPAHFSLSRERINEIAEEIWQRELKDAHRSCNDCGVEPGTPHLPGCDVARCQNCGGQALSCGCPEEKLGDDIWEGIWPGTKTCYEKKLITTHDGINWGFDYNEEALLRIQTNEKP